MNPMTDERAEFHFNEVGSRFSGINGAQGEVGRLLGLILNANVLAAAKSAASEATTQLSMAQTLTSEAGQANQAFKDELLGAGGGSEEIEYTIPTEAVSAAMNWGESLRGYLLDVTTIAAFSFVPPASGTLRLGAASFNSPPFTYQTSFSKNFPPPPGTSEGNATSSSTEVQAGNPVTFFVRAWSSDLGPVQKAPPILNIVIEGSWPT